MKKKTGGIYLFLLVVLRKIVFIVINSKHVEKTETNSTSQKGNFQAFLCDSVRLFVDPFILFSSVCSFKGRRGDGEEIPVEKREGTAPPEDSFRLAEKSGGWRKLLRRIVDVEEGISCACVWIRPIYKESQSGLLCVFSVSHYSVCIPIRI